VALIAVVLGKTEILPAQQGEKTEPPSSYKLNLIKALLSFFGLGFVANFL